MSDRPIPWYWRYTFGAEIRFAGIEGQTMPKDWFFKYEAAIDRDNGKGRKCFWPRVWIRVCGFSIGAGLYIDLGKLIKVDTNAAK